MSSTSRQSRLATCGDAVQLKVRVVPGAAQPGIAGRLEDALKVRVSAQPEKGKANAAIVALICKALQLPRGSVRIVSGRHARQKVLEIAGLSSTDILEQLNHVIENQEDK